ncbi:MAG: RNA methyltransferase [Pseudomonadota bacterium]
MTDAPLGPVCVLVEPQMGENIGSAARGMWNFGLTRLRLVAPRDGWPNPRAVATASGAGRLLESAQLYETTAEAIADCQVVYATTARPRELTKRVLTPEEAMREAVVREAEGARVAVLFGRERTGLENEEIMRASAIVSVPVNPDFPSLNLAQCVLLMGYEWRRAAGLDRLTDDPGRGDQGYPALGPDGLSLGRSTLAASGDVERLLGHLVDELETAHFFFPEHKRPSMEASLRNLFHRTPLTDQDVRTLWGVVRALSEGPKRRRGNDPRAEGSSAEP